MNGRRIALGVGFLLVCTVVAALTLIHEPLGDSVPPPGTRVDHAAAAAVGSRTPPPRRSPLAVPAIHEPTPVGLAFKNPPRAGILFDVSTGRVLWELHPKRRLPIASLTKMLTALIIARRHAPSERVRITRRALDYSGSGVGVLPLGRRVKLGALMYGLLLVSGNDAAIALAQHDAGSLPRFVARMNRTAHGLGLSCSHFSTPSGILDRGNYSCPTDLATLARLDLANPTVRRIVGTRHIRLRFPIRGHVLELYNINPFIYSRAPGVTGIKTGLTDAAGRCYVVTAHRGGRYLGVVLLHSPDPLHQIPRLLAAGALAAG